MIRERYGGDGHSVVAVDDPKGGVYVFGFHSLTWDSCWWAGYYFFYDRGYVRVAHFEDFKEFVDSEVSLKHYLEMIALAFGTQLDDKMFVRDMLQIAANPPHYSICLAQTCHQRAADSFYHKYGGLLIGPEPIQWGPDDPYPLITKPNVAYETIAFSASHREIEWP